jgi:hypothetical protein
MRNKFLLYLLLTIAALNVKLHAQDVYIDLNNPHQGIDGVGFCHEGDRQNGDNYDINTSIQQMLDNHISLFRDMLPNKKWEPTKGTYGYSDAAVNNCMKRLKVMQNNGVKTILGIWDLPDWMVNNPSSSNGHTVKNFDDFAWFIYSFLQYAKDSYGLVVDYVDVNETVVGINIKLSASEYVTLIQKCDALFTQYGITTKMNLGSALIWDLQYLKDIYNSGNGIAHAGYPSWHTYRGGSRTGAFREDISYWQNFGAWQQTLNRNLWGTETEYDSNYWYDKNHDVYTWTGAEEMAVVYWRNYYVARMSTSAGWFWHTDYPSHNVQIAYMNNFEPGGQIVETSQPLGLNGDLLSIAYKHTSHNKFVIHALNQTSSARVVNFYGVPAGQPLILYRTNEAGDRYTRIGTFTPNGTTLTVTLTANSFNTFVGSLAVSDNQSPAAPTNLRSTATTTSSVSLAWDASTDNVGVAGYDIYSSGNYMGSSTGTSYTVTGLTVGTTYTFTVKAKDAANNYSAASNSLVTSTNTATVVATVYADCGYTGTAVNLPVGSYTLAQLQALGVTNDNISSVQVQSGYMMTLYANNSFAGTPITLTASDDCLVNNNFNDSASSVIVAVVPASIVIQAESYNNMSGVTTETCTEGGQNIGSFDANDWVTYDNINIPVTGVYTVQYRVASLNGGAVIQLEKGGGSVIYGSITVPKTSGWQSWTTVSQTINLNAGTQSFGLKALVSGANINWLSFSLGLKSASAVKAISNPAKYDLHVYPNPANASDMKIAFDLGGDTNVKLKVMDSNGKTVEILENGFLNQGSYLYKFKSELKSGMYFISLHTSEITKTIKVVIK